MFEFSCNYKFRAKIFFLLMHDRRTVKNIPKYAPAQFYIDNVLPRIKEKKIMALKPFVDRLGYAVGNLFSDELKFISLIFNLVYVCSCPDMIMYPKKSTG